MEIILKQDVPNVGFKDDIVTVKNGFGRNYLIPQGFAVLATDSARKVLNENLKQRAFKEQKMVDDAKTIASAIKGIEVKIPAKVSENKIKLFGSVSNADVAAVYEKAGHSIDKKFISIVGGVVKSVGKYNASVRLHREVIVSIDFEVIAE